MNTAIIIHGMPSKDEYFNPESAAQSNKHWLPWVQRQLILQGVLAQTPEMPEPYAPSYEQWKVVFEQFVINEDTILIGHSCGAGFIVRWLSEYKTKVGKVALVAPWMDPSREDAPEMFGNLAVDGSVAARTSGIALFLSHDDSAEILDTANTLRTKIDGLQVYEFADKGHFTMGDMKTVDFPELVEFLVT